MLFPEIRRFLSGSNCFGGRAPSLLTAFLIAGLLVSNLILIGEPGGAEVEFNLQSIEKESELTSDKLNEIGQISARIEKRQERLANPGGFYSSSQAVRRDRNSIFIADLSLLI